MKSNLPPRLLGLLAAALCLFTSGCGIGIVRPADGSGSLGPTAPLLVTWNGELRPNSLKIKLDSTEVPKEDYTITSTPASGLSSASGQASGTLKNLSVGYYTLTAEADLKGGLSSDFAHITAKPSNFSVGSYTLTLTPSTINLSAVSVGSFPASGQLASVGVATNAGQYASAVTITTSDSQVATVSTPNINLSPTMPAADFTVTAGSKAGAADITASGTWSGHSSAHVTVSPIITNAPPFIYDPGASGYRLAITGAGFAPDSTVTLRDETAGITLQAFLDHPITNTRLSLFVKETATKQVPLGVHNFTIVVHVPNAPDSNAAVFQFTFSN